MTAADGLPGVGPAFGWNAGASGRVLFLVAVAFSVFQIVTAAFSPMSTIVVRGLHVGFLLLLAFAMMPSALMGAINGSGVANVVQSAPFTIPLMRRFGYRPEFAGGVEPTSSMGGQIMPPVMGIPTIPNYIITSSLAAPALLKLGVPLIVSHMFVFYFGIMADLTPPVALAAFAAAPFAGVSGMKIGVAAVRIALPGFIVPFMAVYDPSLMLQQGGIGNVLYIFLKSLLAVGLWGAAAIGFLRDILSRRERGVAAST